MYVTSGNLHQRAHHRNPARQTVGVSRYPCRRTAHRRRAIHRKKTIRAGRVFNTFNTLHNANKQIIISSDRPPKEISSLEERLRSRFEWGLIADIQPPDVETRIAILRNRARLDNLDVDDEEIIQFIAEHVVSNIRELEEVLNPRGGLFPAAPPPADAGTHHRSAARHCRTSRKKKLRRRSSRAPWRGAYYSIPVESLLSERRDREIVLPRQVAMYLCHDMLGIPYKRISTLFDKNDHMSGDQRLQTRGRNDSGRQLVCLGH